MTNTVEAVLTARDLNFTSTMKKAQNVTESFGSKLKSGIGFGMWQAVGMKAVNAVFGLIDSSVDGAVRRFDTLNNFPKVMESLGFEADDAKKAINQLGYGIAHLPTTLDKVTSQTQQIVAVTGDLDKATRLTLALNNAMAAGGAPAEQQASAINQWVQAMSKGKPDLQDWRAMVSTAPAQMDQLAKAILGANANQADLYKALQDGTVTVDQVNDKMIELAENGGDGFASWAEQAKSASAGIQMSIGNVKASVQRNMANIFQAINDGMLKPFGGIAGVIQKAVPAFDFLGETIGGIFSGDMSVEEGIGVLLDKISALSEEFVPKGMEMISKIIEGIGSTLPTLIPKAVQVVGTIVSGIVQGLPQLVVAGLKALTNLVKGMESGRSTLLTTAGKMVKAFGLALIKALPQIVLSGVKLIVALISGIVRGAVSLPAKAFAVAKKIPSAIKKVVPLMLDAGKQIVNGLWNGIKAKFDGIVEKLKEKAKKLPKAVKAVLGIKSPSRVFEKIGWYTGEGMAIGIEKAQAMVQDATMGLVTIPSALGMNNLALATDYTYGTSASYEIVVPLNINGREFARATANDMTAQQNAIRSRQNRMRGIR